MIKTPSALLKGITGMSQAITWNRMSAHSPAAVIAAYFFCCENHLGPSVQAEVQQLVNLMTSGTESIWYHGSDGEPVSNAGLFTSKPAGNPDVKLIPAIADALDRSINACRDSGHNTIFASLVLKALHNAPEYAFPSVIDGVIKLLKDFEGRGPGMAHVPGLDRVVDARDIPAPLDMDLRSYETTDDMITAVCQYVVPTNFTKKGVGGPIHVINHAVALLDLQMLGYSALVSKGLGAHNQHIRLWLSLPPFPELVNMYRTPCQHDPRTYDYWAKGITLRDQGGYEHRLKFLYGAYRFAEHLVEEEDRRSFLTPASHLF